MPRPTYSIAIIDLEASSLGSASYPTEIGWAIIRDDGSVQSGDCLIRPPSKWTMYANAWSAASERLTGITREMLDRDGLSPVEVMKRFFAAVEGYELYSDEPDFDRHWLTMLAEAASVSLDGRKIGDARRLIEQMGLTIKFGEPQHHRAEPDALRLALAIAQAITPVRS